MPILDLVTPWAAAARAGDTDLQHFLARHADLLEAVRRQRAASEAALPAPTAWGPLAQRAADAAFQHQLREVRDRLSDRGLVAPQQIVLLASAAPGGPVEVIPEPGATSIALFLDRTSGGATHAQAALAAGIAALTRWTAPGNPVATIAARGSWDRWVAAREVPLAEWIYAAGLGVHAAALVAVRPADTLRLGDGELARLRQAERALQGRLDADLDRAGVGLVLRWLEDDAPLAMRRCPDGFVVPPGAGRYLGWRMLAERVERVGIVEAAGMAA